MYNILIDLEQKRISQLTEDYVYHDDCPDDEELQILEKYCNDTMYQN